LGVDEAVHATGASAAQQSNPLLGCSAFEHPLISATMLPELGSITQKISKVQSCIEGAAHAGVRQVLSGKSWHAGLL